MLDAFIIEELRKREEIEKSKHSQPRLELPLEEQPEALPRDDKRDDYKIHQHVIVINV